VLQERRERFLREERLQGWHRQYDGFSEGASFLRDANSLRPYVPTAARVYVQVHNRDLEAALEEKETVQSQVARLEQVEAELTTTRAALADAHRQLDVATATASDARAQLRARDLQLSQAHSALHTVTEKLTMALGRVTDLEMSRSWRWTAPLRLVYGLIQREGCPADTSPRPPAPPVNQ
jgi:DNA repair exonuclease SbcCD ATPase subunit